MEASTPNITVSPIGPRENTREARGLPQLDIGVHFEIPQTNVPFFTQECQKLFQKFASSY